jgi:DNA excision repair protein ERCC-2
VTKGVDVLQISSRLEDRENSGKICNYANLLVELSSVVPDGIVCFFTSYRYMEHITIKWEEMKILNKIREKKLILIETQNHYETILALENY